MKDSGKPCCDLNPAVVYCDKRPWFGSLRGLYAEGWVYSQSDIWHMGAHGSQQKQVVVTGKGKVKGKDTLFKLMYLASTSTKEADGMIISHKNDLVL